MNNLTNRLILLELNEINFDVVEKYTATDPKRYPWLRKLLARPRIRTICEKRYEHLEPWIQWVSVHTAKTYQQHSIFRLGDIVGSGVPQIFELLERAGYKVGAVSAMNAENRLKNPTYFIPDPWTQTPADSSLWSQSLGQAISQAVNDNAQSRITARSLIQLFCALLRFAQVRHYKKYLSLIAGSTKKPWLKALVLDLLLHDFHWTMFNNKKPDFSVLFLNAGAHVQHHYLFNSIPLRETLLIDNPPWYVKSDQDPLADVLEIYDTIVGQYFSSVGTEIILATGLSQKPYDRLKYYYRLKSHTQFLHSVGISFRCVFPRMTRDFLIEFENESQAMDALNILSRIQVDEGNIPLFGEIDNRGRSLFVTLTYPNEITTSTRYYVGDRRLPLLPEVSFVAIKNGMHQAEGFAFFTSGVANEAPKNGAHVADLGKTILRYFGLSE